MNWHSDCGVIIPCLNEAATIGEVVAGARAFFATVLVVDDGSDDATSQRAHAGGAIVVRHSHPQGKGAALCTGMRLLRQRGILWALLMDGDGQHSPEDIPAFLREAASSSAALVIGNRMGQASKMPRLRRIVNRWMSWQLSRLSGADLPDSQCGFRLVNLCAWGKLAMETAHFEIESEMLISLLAAGHQVRFVPVRVIYRREASKIRPGVDSWRWLRWWWQARRKRNRDAAPHQRCLPMGSIS